MNRKSFIRHTLLGFASLLLPEVLRPMDTDCLFDIKRMQVNLDKEMRWQANMAQMKMKQLIEYAPPCGKFVSIDWSNAPPDVKKIIQQLIHHH